MAIPKRTDTASERGFMARLGRDTSGNTLALATAGIMALMGMVGGAVDMSRSYMVSSRLQQACDAGALAARKAMSGETLTEANKALGYRYFDFNFPSGTLGATLISRTYSQPTSSLGTPQAVVNGVVLAAVPGTIMKVFGNDAVDLRITCSSKMEIQSADVAMVLDVTGSMGTSMRISSSGSTYEPRINALHKAVRAFYTALGPGRAGGDLSRGRIRYAFVPYGVVVNVGHLLSHSQLVDSATYQSRDYKSVWAWEYSGVESTASWSSWSPASAPTTAIDASLVAANYSGWSSISGSGSQSYTKHDGTTANIVKANGAANSTACTNSNTLVAGALVAAGKTTGSTSTDNDDVAPVHPATSRTRNSSESKVNTAVGFRYSWGKHGSGTNHCRLQYATGDSDTQWTESRTKTTTRPVAWTSYSGIEVWEPRTIDVSGLKRLLGGWNSSITVPRLQRNGTGTIEYEDKKLSGTFDVRDIYARPNQSKVVDWRGCVEERQMVNTITSTTSIDSIPTGAYDLDSTLLANSSDDATRWRPWLPDAVFDLYDNTQMASDSDCPAPALRLQEIGDYDQTILTSPYPNLFEASDSDPDSHYYPYTTSLWSGTGTTEERSKNRFTLRNYIQRIDTTRGLTDGTLHDAGFIWGVHLLSGVGMFAADNPDRFDGQVVNRNIVFMSDGEMNPGEERYVFSGYNQRDGRLAPTSTTNSQMIAIQNRRLRIQCEAAKRQGITVWVVVITSSATSGENYDDLRACASSSSNFKSAATTEELVASFTTIANGIGGLRISH